MTALVERASGAKNSRTSFHLCDMTILIPLAWLTLVRIQMAHNFSLPRRRPLGLIRSTPSLAVHIKDWTLSTRSRIPEFIRRSRRKILKSLISPLIKYYDANGHHGPSVFVLHPCFMLKPVELRREEQTLIRRSPRIGSAVAES